MGALLFGELSDFVVSAAQFKRAGMLQVFGLDKDLVFPGNTQHPVRHQIRPANHLLQALPRLQNHAKGNRSIHVPNLPILISSIRTS